jgi:hypothetical protein
MSQSGTVRNLNQMVVRSALIHGAAVIFLSLLPPGRAIAQSTAGPLPAAAPSDQPTQAQPAPSRAQTAGKPMLAGAWKLNADQSDNPMQKMREEQQESGGGFGGARRGGGFGGGGGNGGGQQTGNEAQDGGNRRRGGGMQAMAQLVIEQTPTSVKVTDSSGRVIALYQSQPDQAGSSPSNSPTNPPPPALWQDDQARDQAANAEWRHDHAQLRDVGPSAAHRHHEN